MFMGLGPNTVSTYVTSSKFYNMVKDELLNLKVATFDINKYNILNVSMYF